MCDRKVWLQPDRLGELYGGFLKATHVQESGAQTGVCFRGSWIITHCLTQIRNRLRSPTLPREGVPQVEFRLSVVRLQANGFPEAGLRLRESSLQRQHHAQIVLELGAQDLVRWAHGEPSPEDLGCVGAAPRAHQHRAEIHVRLQVARHDADGALEFGGRRLVHVLPHVGDAQVVVHVGRRRGVLQVGHSCEDIAVVADRLVVPAQRVQYVADVDHRHRVQGAGGRRAVVEQRVLEPALL